MTPPRSTPQHEGPVPPLSREPAISISMVTASRHVRRTGSTVECERREWHRVAHVGGRLNAWSVALDRSSLASLRCWHCEPSTLATTADASELLGQADALRPGWFWCLGELARRVVRWVGILAAGRGRCRSQSICPFVVGDARALSSSAVERTTERVGKFGSTSHSTERHWRRMFTVAEGGQYGGLGRVSVPNCCQVALPVPAVPFE